MESNVQWTGINTSSWGKQKRLVFNEWCHTSFIVDAPLSQFCREWVKDSKTEPEASVDGLSPAGWLVSFGRTSLEPANILCVWHQTLCSVKTIPSFYQVETGWVVLGNDVGHLNTLNPWTHKSNKTLVTVVIWVTWNTQQYMLMVKHFQIRIKRHLCSIILLCNSAESKALSYFSSLDYDCVILK